MSIAFAPRLFAVALVLILATAAAKAQVPTKVHGTIVFGEDLSKIDGSGEGTKTFTDPKGLFGMARMDKPLVQYLDSDFAAHLNDETKAYPNNCTIQVIVFRKEDGQWQRKNTGLFEQRSSALYETYTEATFPLEIVADVEFYKTKRDYYANSTFSQWPATVMNTLGGMGEGTHEIMIAISSMETEHTGQEAFAAGEFTLTLTADHASWLQAESKRVRRYKRDYKEDQKLAEMEETWSNATTLTTNTGRELQVRSDGIFENREPLGRLDNGKYIMGIFVVGESAMNEYKNASGGTVVKIERAAPGKAEYVLKNASDQEIGRILEDGTINKGDAKWGSVKFNDPAKLEIDDERTRIATALWHHTSFFRD